jgi:hypothetical protein
MLERLIPFLLLAGAAYWYWTGPYQESQRPDYDKKLMENGEIMQRCLRGKAYVAGATGGVEGDPEILCAKKNNLYKDSGQWHSYDDVRRDD